MNVKRLLLFVLALSLVVFSGLAGAEETKGKQSDQSGVSCVSPAKGPLQSSTAPAAAASPAAKGAEIKARVGKPAPDFEANAFVDGAFKNVKLSDYKGKWVVLCFYPGDFTFV